MSELSLKLLNITNDKSNDVNGLPRSSYVIVDINEESSEKKDLVTNDGTKIESASLFEELTLIFKNFEEAKEHSRSKDFLNQLNGYEKVIFAKLIIDENFEQSSHNEFEELAKVCSTKSIVLFFMAKNHENFQIFWKSKDIDYFLMLKLFDKMSPKECKEVYGFAADLLIYSLRNGHIGLRDSCRYSKKLNQIELNQLADSRRFDLLQNAAELGELQIVRTLLQMKIFVDNPCNIFNPQSLASKNEHYNIVSEFLHANFSYPPIPGIKKCPEDIRNFQNGDSLMHEAIKSKNFRKVRKILSKNPQHRHFYSLGNESALKAALRVKSFKIYKILVENNITFGPHEKLKQIFGENDDGNRNQVRKIHFKSTKDLPDNHINILMMNTSISHDETNTEDKEHYARRAYDVLNKDPITRIILRAVAAFRNFEVIFDFKRDSVEMVDPTCGSDTKGVFYTSGKICIGAKQLLDPATENDTFGTLAHELCHFAIYLTFSNSGMPYEAKDKIRNEEFKGVCGICEDFCKKEKEEMKKKMEQVKEGDESQFSADVTKYQENIVAAVFDPKCYDTRERHAELIVRAPHLIAMYHNEPEKLAEEKKKYPELFDYYENFVVVEMEKALPGIKKRAEPISIKKVILTGLTFSLALMGLIVYCMYSPNKTFKDLSPSEQDEIRNANVFYKKCSLKFNELYAYNSNAFDQLTPDNIKKILKGDTLSFDDPHLGYLKTLVHHGWGNLTGCLRHKVLDVDLTYQNEILKLSELQRLHPFNSLTSDQIKTILDYKTMTIGQMIQNSTNFYVDRKFIVENALNARVNYSSIKTPKKFAEFYADYIKDKYHGKTAGNSLVHNSVNSVRVNIELQKLIDDLFLHKSLNDVLNSTEKLFILSSEAGAGKTIVFEKMTVEMKRKYPIKWVSYIEIKNHTHLYEEYGNSSNVLGFFEEILSLGSSTKFEREVFINSYKSDNLVLFWNGFDEISPKHRDSLISIMTIIRSNSSNVQFICTRPSFSMELTHKFNTEPLMLVPFSKSEQEIFLKKYFMTSNITALDADRNVLKVMTTIRKLTEKDIRTFDTPLMLRLAAEVIEFDDTESPLNIYDIYDKFVDKKWKLWNKKNIRGDESNHAAGTAKEISKIFQQFAVKVEIFTFAFFMHPSLRKLHVFKKSPPSKSKFPEISQLGILHINTETQFMFAHKTFAEFFIAQYLIENIYELNDEIMNEAEADARLELLFLTFQFHSTFEKVLEFVESYLDGKKNETGKFNSYISDILKIKYKNYLINILNRPAKVSFRIFFKFFKKDRELLVDLLKVHKDETFYTALFNPFYDSKFIDHFEVRSLTESYLNGSEFKSFTNGKNQKGIKLFGLFDKKNISGLNSYGLKVTAKTDFWEFYDKFNASLTRSELKQLYTNPVVTFIYRKYSSGSINNQNFWLEVNKLFEQSELKNFIGNMLAHLFRPQLTIPKATEVELLQNLVAKANNSLSSQEIFEMASKYHFQFRSGRNYPQFEIVWNFLASHTNRHQRRELLKYDYKKEEEESLLKSSKNLNEQNFYSVYYKFFIMTPKILHLVSFQDNFTEAFPLVTKIYEENFEKWEIKKIISESNDFFFPLVFIRTKEICQDFVDYLENLYKGDESSLLELLNSNFSDTSSSVFDYFDGLTSFNFGDRDNVQKRLETFSALRKRLTNSIT